VPPSCSTFGFHGTSKVLGNVAGHTSADPNPAHPSVKATGQMGRIVSNEIDPTNFLRRTDATTVRAAGNNSPARTAAAATHSAAAAAAAGEGAERDLQAHQHSRIHQPSRPAVPTRTEKPVMGLQSGKNFVAENAREIAGAVPRVAPQPQRAVDLPDFTKVPQYLVEIKTQLAEEKAVAKSRAVASASAVDYDELTAAEVAELRAGLQHRWDELSRQIKSLPFKLETRSQIRRKEVLESDFAAVEAAMAKLSRKRILIMH
jgi:hypothetical protein